MGGTPANQRGLRCSGKRFMSQTSDAQLRSAGWFEKYFVLCTIIGFHDDKQRAVAAGA